MAEPLSFLLRHPYSVIFGAVLTEQLGLPLPAAPLLLAAGALAGMDRLDPTLTLGLTLAASLIADCIWYETGRRRGNKVLGFLCRLSLEPDSCVRRTENVFARYGAKSLLVAKFLPGLSALATPLAGVTGLSRGRFLLFDGVGALLWGGAYLGLGFAFSDRLEALVMRLAAVGHGLTSLIVALLLAYVLVKFLNRRRFLRSLRLARIAPEELKRRLHAGEDVFVVDLRSERDFAAGLPAIPGARRFTTAEIADRHAEIPRDREVVLYCT